MIRLKASQGVKMWPKAYRDYKTDETLTKCDVEPSHGIIGCEMHDLNGWGESYHRFKKRKKGLLSTLLTYFFRSPQEPL